MSSHDRDTTPWSLPRLQAALAALQPRDPPAEEAPKRAAVAAVLRFDGPRPQVLLMQRTHREGDRWSGQVSFPGGREDIGDPHLLATAVRETREEVGLDLDRTARLLGRLDGIQAVARGRALPLSITPYVFHCVEPTPLALNHEAESAFWFPLDRASRGGLDAIYEYQLGDAQLSLPSWRYGNYVVWGMTHLMLLRLIDLARS